MAFSLTGCDKYQSHYNAVGCITSGDFDDHGFIIFTNFKGTMVFKMKCADNSSLRYSGTLEEGNVKVYYDNGDQKTDLFEISGGEEIDVSEIDLNKGTVYVIVEAEDNCESGDFRFKVV